MELVNLKNGYLLAGFENFESALAATEQFCGKGFKVVYLNEATHVREQEVREFARSFAEPDGPIYQNYHFARKDKAMKMATESFKTAVEVLEEKSNCRANYVVVLNRKD